METFFTYAFIGIFLATSIYLSVRFKAWEDPCEEKLNQIQATLKELKNNK